MKTIIIFSLIVLLILPEAFAAASYVGGTTQQCVSQTFCTANYTPINVGDIIVGCSVTSLTGASPTMADSSSGALTAASIYSAGAPEVALFYYAAPSPLPTLFTTSWSGTRNGSILIAEYSNVNSVNGCTSGCGSPTSHGAATTQTVAPTANEENDVVVGCLGLSLSVQQSASVGNLRLDAFGSPGSGALVDILSTGATATTLSTTSPVSGVYSGASLLLRPTGSSGANMVPSVYP